VHNNENAQNDDFEVVTPEVHREHLPSIRLLEKLSRYCPIRMILSRLRWFVLLRLVVSPIVEDLLLSPLP
jgi:hypothetical protein